MTLAEEVILPFPVHRTRVPLASAVRSTVLLASLRALREHDVLDRYLAALAPDQRQRILAVAGAVWLPIELAIRHYATLDKLELPDELVERIGGASGHLVNQTVLGIAVKLTTEVGVTPWTAFAQSHRITTRTWQGSACGVTKIGPKEARFEWVGQPLAASRYFRVAFGGFTHALLSLFCRKAFVRQLPKLVTPSTIAYRCSWV